MTKSKNRLRITTFPSGTGEVREYVFSHGFLRVTLIALPLMALVGVYLWASGALRKDFEPLQHDRLVSENDTLRGQLKRLSSATDTLVGKLRDGRLEELAQLTGLMEVPSLGSKVEASASFLYRRQAGRGSNAVLASLSEARELSRAFDSAIAHLKELDGGLQSWPTTLPAGRQNILSRHFGYFDDPFTGKKAFHQGVDFSGKTGDPVFASGHGEVVETGDHRYWGLFVKVRHADSIHTFYAHLNDVQVKKGDRVEKGQSIATLGSSGVSSGAHLHYELHINGKPVDPERFWLRQSRPLLLAAR